MIEHLLAKVVKSVLERQKESDRMFWELEENYEVQGTAEERGKTADSADVSWIWPTS